MLLFVSVLVFLTVLLMVLVALRLSTGHNSYIVQYRSSVGINNFTTGSIMGLLDFIVFGFLVLVTHVVLSIRTYHIHRQLSVVILGLGVLLLVLAIIVSNALLVLR